MTTNNIKDLLEQMWRDYSTMNPQAYRIYHSLLEKEDKIVNDHIALRTFNDPRIGIDVLKKPFIESGYVYKGEYHFTAKKLYAQHFEHLDPLMPKIFISELKLEEFSDELQQTVRGLIDQVPEELYQRFDFVNIGRPWDLDFKTYEKLLAESEYAGWVSAHGFRPNHFTIFVNHLKSIPSLRGVNDFIKRMGFKLNDSGGEIKGSKEVMLRQSSTLADRVAVAFSDGEHEIPACYYEFAYRYPKSNGVLYTGFVAQSADKIFESTNKSQ
ncbi:DUF1338 domain-containing protein [Persicobacter psychrovividus]|uniref:2-oxoadipate dioxygenase/decarboxylase n=1 Tax=Persicobacter psychrovividus TaxID=387638 RepID=A0ABN6LDN0_9BACT|nr:DUF1338 domain-containing protein [Persicobacter psychrovividus]